MTTGTTKISYVKQTHLSEDFRTLLVPKPKPQTARIVVDYCPVCLNEFVDARTLPCYHTFCKRCLQYAIDKAPPDPDQDRGFVCILCGFFVRVPDYSIPRKEWADQIPADFSKQTEEKKENKPDDSDSYTYMMEEKEREITKQWVLEWQLSTYSKSYFLQKGLDPYRRTKKGFRYIKGLRVTEDNISDETKDTNEDFYQDKTELNDNGDEGPVDDNTKESRITAITLHNSDVVVYDQGLSEVLVYNPDLTIKSALPAESVFGLAVLDSLLYMTNPNQLCIDVVDLQTMELKPSINITMKCYGITSLGEELAVLLWDINDQNLHICFVDDCCITGGYIPLMTGAYDFKSPRKLAGCPRTRLLYVSDAEAGLVKCFRPDGKLKWEKIVYGAGDITVFNCYAFVARRFTHSVDVLSERGSFMGRLQSEDYGLISPSVLETDTETAKLVISDQEHMVHCFKVKTKIDSPVEQSKKVSTSCVESCACSVS